MPPKATPQNSPSPSKKRKTDSTPVKRGVDFFFKRQVEKNQQAQSNGELLVPSNNEVEWEVKRRLQEEEDERLARELQDMEERMEIDDEEFARRLAIDYEAKDKDSNGTKEQNVGGGNTTCSRDWLAQ